MPHTILQTVLDLTGYPRDRVRIELRTPLDFQSNHLFDVRLPDSHWIAKQYAKPDEYDGAPRREFDALRLVAALDVAPRAVHMQPFDGDAPPFVLYEYLDGDMWDRRAPGPAEMAALFELYTRIHSVTRTDLWPAHTTVHSPADIAPLFAARTARYAEWAQTYYPPGLDSLRLVTERLSLVQGAVNELASMPAPPLLFCRSDPRFANVIARPDGRLGMVDWEDSGLRDPALEIADLLNHPNQEDLLPPEAWQDFLTAYFATRKNDATFERRLELYQSVVPFFWLLGILNMGVNRAQAGQPTEFPVNDLPASVRAQRYLARILTDSSGDFFTAFGSVGDVSFFPAAC